MCTLSYFDIDFPAVRKTITRVWQLEEAKDLMGFTCAWYFYLPGGVFIAMVLSSRSSCFAETFVL